MEQCVGFFSYDFDEREKEVAGILCQLRQLILEKDSSQKGRDSPFYVTPNWGAKRRRSAIDVSPSPPHPSLFTHPTPAPLHRPSHNGESPSFRVESPSPATPLSFSPGESEKRPPKPFKRKSSKKKTREELLHTVVLLSENLEFLKQEIPKTVAHHNMLLDKNLKLKARKLELEKLQRKRDEPNHSITITSSDSSFKTTERLASSLASKEEEDDDDDDEAEEEEEGQLPHSQKIEENQLPWPQIEEEERPFTVHQPKPLSDPSTSGSEISRYSQHPCGRMPPLISTRIGWSISKNLSPIGIVDLNYPAEEALRWDFMNSIELDRAAVAALARKKRIEINRAKTSMASLKSRCK
ncbi:PREDICTED: uncharacterized protein LOC104600136 [Nelumbo nucifera]|uniref:Uncharacterized protein n=2 Tax=Nelumbo nucifera TaxID=4432 RepID=A0A822Z5H0_NELNU|nr:PREDICTED: uncharacterized protein LOC104600136 [Nelumbo nucifera]DAD40322.1 TPA_asm: hypothetical protein HUJ06_014645 [Nelumbo nucifera]